MNVAFRVAFLATLGVSEAACSLVADLGPPKTKVLVQSEPASDGGAPPPVQPCRIAVGPTQACAVVRDACPPAGPVDGAVRCWGSNGSSELGSDPSRVGTMSARPLPVAGLSSGVTELALAAGYGCAVTTDRWLFGWGTVPMDSLVQKEQGGRLYQAARMKFLTASIVDVATASVGAHGGCYTLTSGKAVCWGDFAQTGIQEGMLVPFPGPIAGMDQFERVAVGRAHACAIAKRIGVRDVECWGANERGQAGISPRLVTHVSAPTPMNLWQFGAIQQVAVGQDDSCALLKEGQVYCWGANDHGQLGNLADGGPDAAQDLVPTKIPLVASAIEIAVGESHACALLDDRSVQCWGDNQWGQLGIGSPDQLIHPTLVQKFLGGQQTLTAVQHIAAGGRTTCAIQIDKPLVWCWGANDLGQAGQTPQSSFVSYATEVAW